ncbi:Hypothetical protein (Fragment) [Durusdinium trenchii]|uniref:Uncharacterized protein n=1 Tax=Durusdinium trenchii TaxID=1381693 RepID=A0ABP0NX42_9DINO
MPRDRAAWRGGGAGPLPSAISRAGVDADADVDLQPELAPKVHAGRLPACEDVLALSATELGEEVKAISGPASTSAGSSPSSFSARPERYRRAAQLLHGAFEVEKAAEHEFAGPDPPALLLPTTATAAGITAFTGAIPKDARRSQHGTPKPGAKDVAQRQWQSNWDEITKGWDKDGGACRRGKVPDELWETWCTSGVPIMAIGEGELMVTAGSSESPSVMFLGVQVHAVLGIPRFPGKGVTVTPRFILRNASESFVQVMPGLLPNKKSGDEPAVTNRVEEIIKEFSGPDTMDIMEFIARDPIADQAVWIPPGESLAIFHFPLRCQASEVSQARKAVALRLPGREPLQLIHVEAKGPLQLQQVLTSGVIPYKDHPWQSGRLPPRMRMLAQEGRLMCLRWKYLKDFQLGDLILTSACEMFIGLPISELGAEWLRKEPWKECEALDLRSQGHHKITLQMFTAQMKAGRCNFDGVGRGCVIFLAQRIDNDYDLQMGKGLPWSGWLGLNNTQEKVVALSSAGSTGGASGVSFMRCSVQVRNSTAFMILSDEPPPYRVENWSDSRTLAVRFLGDDYCEILPPLSWFAFDWPTRAQHEKKERYLILQDRRSGHGSK